MTLGSAPRTLVLVSIPLSVNGHVTGTIAVFEDLQFLVDRLKDTARRGGGLEAYVVDAQGRLVAGANSGFATGQDMTDAEIVKNFVDQRGRVHIAPTLDFVVTRGKERLRMLGTYSMVPSLGWAVVAQKPQAAAYEGVYEMQREMRLLALLAVIISVLLSIAAARTITHPIEVLTSTSAAISRGDFSRRVAVQSRTEIGELASTFNAMSEALEKFVADLKHAAEENRTLFLSSIQMLAGAVDEKDPYTRGHSDRVTRYSVLIATEMGLPAEEIERIRVAAQLHDVGKIGIEDRVLKKPSALTPEEFSLMKAHATKGANILRPVRQLTEVLPGIELHHESMDGHGYPYGLKGEEIPLMARIIMVADTFDAMTTDRPYQTAMEPEYVVRMINSLAGTKFDPSAVQAVTKLFERGELMKKDSGWQAAGNTIS
jgi:HD-GYP domain-containing protein (c-di-GMP phosphodiesterase class II)